MIRVLKCGKLDAAEGIGGLGKTALLVTELLVMVILVRLSVGRFNSAVVAKSPGSTTVVIAGSSARSCGRGALHKGSPGNPAVAPRLIRC